jgi:voltage-dependent calcium channel
VRNETTKLVTDLVNLDRVRSLLRSISCRRQFLAHLEKKRAEKYEKGMFHPLFCPFSVCLPKIKILLLDIPSILVENMPETPPMSSRDIASAGLESANASPATSDSRFQNPRSISMDLTAGSRLQRSGHGRQNSDFSFNSLSMDIAKPS